MDKDTFREVIYMLPHEIVEEVNSVTHNNINSLTEIRMRTGQVCSYRIIGSNKKYIRGRMICDKYLLNECINKFINYSYYAYEEQLRNGYITLFGGHRAGICGRAVIENGKVILLSDITSINIRHAIEFKGISQSFVNQYLLDNRGFRSFPNTLVASPPGCGKTTFLRDMVRVLSNEGYNISICDERSEIAGVHEGLYSFDLGPNTDVMDSCPKTEGMRMLLRSMSPDIIVTDEIGSISEIELMKQALTSGIGIITTIHAASMDEIEKGNMNILLKEKLFSYIVFLSKEPSPGTIREIYEINKTFR